MGSNLGPKAYFLLSAVRIFLKCFSMSKCSRNTKVTFLYFPKNIHRDQFDPRTTIDLMMICKVFLRCLSIMGRIRYTGVRVLIFPKQDFFRANKGFGGNLAQGFAGLCLPFGCILRGVLPWWGRWGRAVSDLVLSGLLGWLGACGLWPKSRPQCVRLVFRGLSCW